MIHQVTRPTIDMIQTGQVIYTYIVDRKLSKKNRILIIFANMCKKLIMYYDLDF